MTLSRPGFRLATIVSAVVALVLVFAACSGSNSNKDSAKVPELEGAANGESTTATNGERKSWAGEKPALEFPTGLTWFNVSKPPTLAALKGKVVLLDFWTAGCINCQHIIPDLKRLEAEHPNELVVIGVHSGKYATEHEDESIRESIGKYGIAHAVVNDADFTVWDLYGASAWPTLVLIDPAGNLVGGHAGEGVYELFKPIVASLVEEFDEKNAISRVPFVTDLSASSSSTVLSYPGKVLADGKSQRIFIADSSHHRILVASLNGELQQVIGSGVEGFADGRANEAEFREPQGLALSADGTTLYVADTRNHSIRAVRLSDGEVTTIAGTGQQLDRFPQPGADPRKTALASPWDVLVADGVLYISMAGVHQIWSLDLKTNALDVFAGTSREGINDGDRRTMATLAQPSGLTTDGDYLYWVDPESSSVRRVLLDGSGEVDTLAGTGLFDYGDEDGAGDDAKLQHPQGVAWVNGTLFVADTYNHKIRSVDPKSKLVLSISGEGERGWLDGDGSDARYDEPSGISALGSDLYVADTNNHLVRVVDSRTGDVRTVTLSNLAVLNTAPGRVLKVSLPGQSIAPGVSSLRVQVVTPEGHKLNSLAPSKLTLATSNPAVIEPGERTLAWSSDEPGLTLEIPAIYGDGQAVLTATGQLYYCRENEEALCFIQQVEISIPLTVTPSSSLSLATLAIELPPGS